MKTTAKKTTKKSARGSSTKRGAKSKALAPRTAARTARAPKKRASSTRKRPKKGLIDELAQRFGGFAGRAAKALTEPIDLAQRTARKLTGDMDATKLLKGDHRRVKMLFAAYKASGDQAIREKEDLFTQIDLELTLHTQVEEEIFYPAVKALRGEESRMIAEAVEEHGIVKMLLEQLRELEPGGEEFEAKMKVMMEGVLHHAREEERNIFPAAKKGLGGDRLDALGQKIDQEKQEILERIARKQAV